MLSPYKRLKSFGVQELIDDGALVLGICGNREAAEDDWDEELTTSAVMIHRV